MKASNLVLACCRNCFRRPPSRYMPHRARRQCHSICTAKTSDCQTYSMVWRLWYNHRSFDRARYDCNAIDFVCKNTRYPWCPIVNIHRRYVKALVAHLSISEALGCVCSGIVAAKLTRSTVSTGPTQGFCLYQLAKYVTM
jgi:hypothetical protein